MQGLAGGDIGKALARGASPYLAEVIHRQTTNADGTLNKEANLMAHAVLGAALAAVQGNNALGGAAAGVTAEFVAQQMYPGIPVDKLTEEQKQTISTLATLAAGLAGGLIGDSTADTVGAAQIGKNAVENNALSGISLPDGLQSYGQGQSSLGISMIKSGASPDEIAAALSKAAKGDMPEGQNAARGLLVAWAEFFGVPVSALTADGDMTPKRAAEIVASGIPTSEAKLIQYITAKAFLVVSERAGSIKNVNPGYPEPGRTHNCVNCSIATDATLAGNPASALPINHKNGVPLTVLEKQYGSKFMSVSDQGSIIQQMTEAGAGARGIIYGSYGPGQPGHVFNVVNQNGKIRFLDGQTGKAADLSKFDSFKILRTN